MPSKDTIANNLYRDKTMNDLEQFFTERGEDVLRTASNTFCFPYVNANGNDEFLRIVVSVPKGSRGETGGYDGYEQAEQFKQKEEQKKEKARIAEEKKKKKIEQDKKDRAEKAKRLKEEKGQT